MVQNTSLAEDITQDVFISVFKTISSFNGKCTLSTWVYRITINKSIDYIRAEQRRLRWLTFSAAKPLEGSDFGESARNFDHPGIILEQKTQAKYLFNAINQLPQNQKTAFILAYIEDLPQQEIADIMNTSLKAVESLLQRAKKHLREKLGAIYEKQISKSVSQ